MLVAACSSPRLKQGCQGNRHLPTAALGGASLQSLDSTRRIPPQEVKHEGNDSEYKQDMNQKARRVEHQEAPEPQQNQNHSYT